MIQFDEICECAGQGIVQFAEMMGQPGCKFAIKFFLSKAEFDVESAYYNQERYRSILPPADHVESNEDGRHCDPFGGCVTVVVHTCINTCTAQWPSIPTNTTTWRLNLSVTSFQMFIAIIWESSGPTYLIEVNTNLVSPLTSLRATRTAVTATPTAGVLLLFSSRAAAPVPHNIVFV